jgi:hypothetical protein
MGAPSSAGPARRYGEGVLNRLVDAWNQKERARDGLVPDAFTEDANQRRLRTASWVRGLLAVVIAGLAVVFFVGPGLSTPVLAAVLGALGIVTVALVVTGLRALAVLAAVEREASEPLGSPGGTDARTSTNMGARTAAAGGTVGDGSAALVRTGDERAELGERVDLEHEHGVQSDDVQ